MCDCSIKFRITDAGYLEVSYDKECTWEQIGKVKGDASTQAGPQGPQGPVGPRGAAGTNGTNGVTPYISQSTGNWVVNGVDTGIKAAGSNGTISVEASQDIATVGTPNVTTRTVNNELIIQFHQLKGAPGVAPTITATRDGNQVFFKVDGVTVATLNDGVVYTAGTYMNIGSGNVLNCTIVQATSSALGLVKLGSDTVQTEAAQTPSATSGRTYPVQVDSDGKAVVNVPWQEGAGQTYTAGDNIDIDENNVIKAKLPKEEHKLIYYQSSINNIYAGLLAEQLMYEEGIVVDNPTDLSRCKNSNDFTIHEIGTTWATELMSNNKYLQWTSEGGYSQEIDASSLLPGGILNTTNGFWYYNQGNYTIDAKFNDNYFSRLACLYNPNTPSNVFHDALYGYFDSSIENDSVGCGFIGFGTTLITDDDGSWYPTVVLAFNGSPQLKYNFNAATLNFSIYKKKSEAGVDNREKYMMRTSNPREGIKSAPGFDIIGVNTATLVSGTSVETGKCVVRNTSLLTNPFTSLSYYGPSYIRIRTEKVGNVITWKLSQVLVGSITDVEAQTPALISRTKIQFDMDNYKVRYITNELSNWAEFDCSAFSTYIDVLKNDAHFMFKQSSTPSGRIYNINTMGTKLILDIDTDIVWQRTNNVWAALANTAPLDLFRGSHINFNDVTKKLWYSNGARIYQIGGEFEDE